MGRKGGGGGTAGGGRSGRKGNIAFNRVIPKFLQNIQGQIAAETATVRQSVKHQEDGVSQKSRKSYPSQEPTSSEVIAELEKEGFRVVEATDERASSGRADSSGTEKQNSERQNKVSPKKHTNSLKGVALGSVTKKKSRRVRPSKAFGISNSQRLSFAAEGSESDQSD